MIILNINIFLAIEKYNIIINYHYVVIYRTDKTITYKTIILTNLQELTILAKRLTKYIVTTQTNIYIRFRLVN